MNSLSYANQHQYVSIRVRSNPEIQRLLWQGMKDELISSRSDFGLISQPWDLGTESLDPACIGIIADVRNADEMERLSTYSVPTVCISNQTVCAPNVKQIAHDDDALGQLAARHLLQLGYRSFGAICNGRRFSRARVNGFSQEIEAYEDTEPVRVLQVEDTLWNGHHNPDQGLHALWEDAEDFIHSLPPNAGILTTTGRYGQHVLDLLKGYASERAYTLGVVAIGSFEPHYWVPGESIGLTRVSPGTQDVGRAAVKWFTELKGHTPCAEEFRTPIWVPPAGLEQHGSSSGYACANPVAGKAGRLIWESVQLGEIPSMEQVAGHVNCSVRSLRRLFLEHHGCGYRDYLTRVQMDQAIGLLKDSNKTVADIAAACGYSSQSIFARAFRKATGMAPQEWRRAPGDSTHH